MEIKWLSRKKVPAIYPGELHVWKAPLTSDLNLSEQILAESERVRMNRYHFEYNRKMFLLGHTLLRHLLGAYLDKEPKQIEFNYSSYGKPFLTNSTEGTHLEFNLSHSGDILLIAVTQDTPVGVDVEKIRFFPDIDQISKRFFSTGEQQDLNSLAGSDKVDAFFRCWTRKEAVIKACGEGLSMPLDSFQVSLLPGEPARLLSSSDSRSWMLVDLVPEPGYAAAVVTADRRQVSCYISDGI